MFYEIQYTIEEQVLGITTCTPLPYYVCFSAPYSCIFQSCMAHACVRQNIISVYYYYFMFIPPFPGKNNAIKRLDKNVYTH